jgi:D-beta-D-heptose 7-phosphate kinase/D-beta-D-heptose 1-phosphate adenosyltransferase
MKILVVGDSCVDVFIYGEVNRLAPEAPVPVIIPHHENKNPGMAANVANNLKVLGVEVDLITNKSLITKTRYVCSKYNHLLLRVDQNDRCENFGLENNCENIIWSDYDAVIVSDYAKGFLTESDILEISEKHPLTFLDTKKILGDWANRITFIKINNEEWLRNKTFLSKNEEIFSKTLITKGKHGCEYRGRIYPTQEVSVKDVSGAGDTFLSSLVFKYVQTKDLEESIKFAQEMTTIVVQKSGVSTI